MKKLDTKKILVAGASLAMIGAQGLPIAAENQGLQYTPIAGEQVPLFKKYLVLDNAAQVPNVTFNYTVSKPADVGTSANGRPLAVLASAGNMEIYVGVGAPTLSTAAFSAADVKLTEKANGDDFVLDAGESYVRKIVNIDFTGVEFPEPGIYRYIITEEKLTGEKNAFLYDTQDSGAHAGEEAAESRNGSRKRILDVYVIEKDADNVNGGHLQVGVEEGLGSARSNGLTVDGYVLHDWDTDIDAILANATNGSQDATRAADTGKGWLATDVADKSDGFVNEYLTQDLIFGKEVIGNQGSRDKYFEFTLNLGNLDPNSEYVIDLICAEATSGSNTATIAANQDKNNYVDGQLASDGSGQYVLKANAEGTITQKFYLKDGQYIRIQGLAIGSTYQVTEAEEDYKKIEKIQAGLNKTARAVVNGVGTSIANGAVIESFLDNLSGTIAEEVASPVAGDNVGDIFTGFTNQRQGTIPTGVMMTVLPGAMVVLSGGAGVWFLMAKKREDEE